MRTPTFKRLPWGIVSLLFLLTAAAAWSQELGPSPKVNRLSQCFYRILLFKIISFL